MVKVEELSNEENSRNERESKLIEIIKNVFPNAKVHCPVPRVEIYLDKKGKPFSVDTRKNIIYVNHKETFGYALKLAKEYENRGKSEFTIKKNYNGKNDLLDEFISDIKVVLRKIEKNFATTDDYQVLQEYIELTGLKSEHLIEPLNENGFSSWEEFYQERMKPRNEQNVLAVSVVEGSIIGVVNATIDYLKEQKD